MIRLAIEAPWYTYQKKLKALFENDPDITVGEVFEQETDFGLNIEVTNHEKFLALDRTLPCVRKFGNVNLAIFLYDEENAEDASAIDLYETIFKGNPIVKDIKRVTDPTGALHGYVRFQPEVIQFPDDDISDYNGNWSGLAQDIAREVFDTENRGVHFCTADKRENDEVPQATEEAEEADNTGGADEADSGADKPLVASPWQNT